MEPIAVLSLVANIVQLVDAAGKAFTICREIYILGETIEDSRTTFVSRQLLNANSDLSKSVKPSNSSAGSSNPLFSLASKCFQTAQDLQAELDSIRTSPGSGFRSTFRKTWLKKKKTKIIDKLKLALDEYQKTLNAVILIDVRQALGALEVKNEGRAKGLEQQLKSLSLSLQSCQSNLGTRLKSEVDKQIQASEKQHMVTRDTVNAHVTRTMQDLSLLQQEQSAERDKRQHTLQQCGHLLNSFRYSEIHNRMNDVVESHADTFEWIFEQDTTRPWDSFSNWLKEGNTIYWINGKPGSGKSTLMKFLVSHPRTSELLAQWRRPFLIIQFYFWLSGSEMQRSFKGFLCSIIYQVIQYDNLLSEKLLQGDPKLLAKRTPGDWSQKELRDLLIRIVGSLEYSLCIFIDGLDEFSQKDDVDQLLDLSEVICQKHSIKVCISSRLEHYLKKRLGRYSQLRLQDLTVKDMEIYIRTTLEQTRTRCSPSPIDDDYFERIVGVVADKADGVFLWVYYALHSLSIGMRNEDTFEDLLQRIERLPSRMYPLYLEMWNRLNKDKLQYRQDAATYFLYVTTCHGYGRRTQLSLFEMLVALNANLQDSIVDELEPQDPTKLARQCETLMSRIQIRTAGLLEVSMEMGYEEPYAADRSSFTTGSLYSQDQRSLCSIPSVDGEAPTTPAIHSPDIDPIKKRASRCDDTLTLFHHTSVRFIHRTARDFLMETEDGQNLSGYPHKASFVVSRNILRGKMAAIVQGCAKFDLKRVKRVMDEIVSHCNWHSDRRLETDSVIALRRVCQRLSIIGVPKRHTGYEAFWKHNRWQPEALNFECYAAQYGFADYIRSYVLEGQLHSDPSCLGLLAIHAAVGRIMPGETHSKFALISWLISHGADLHTSHLVSWGSDLPITPAAEILCAIDYVARPSRDEELPRKLYDSIRTLLQHLTVSSCHTLFYLSTGKKAPFLSVRSFYNRVEVEDHVIVKMSINKLCFYVMEKARKQAPYGPFWSHLKINEEPATRVLWINQANASESCPSEIESLYLGEALDRILFHVDQSSSTEQTQIQDFIDRVRDVSSRSEKKSWHQWTKEYTTRMIESGMLADTSGLSLEKLDQVFAFVERIQNDATPEATAWWSKEGRYFESVCSIVACEDA
ncbi:MAG: hypothetical protein Q9199_006279 [Rusavskia elegans]